MNSEAQSQQRLIMVTSGGVRAPRFDGALNSNGARQFLWQYDAYVDAATTDRKDGETQAVAGLMDLIPKSRQNSLLRTGSTGCRVTEEACRQAVERLAGLSFDDDDEPRGGSSVTITQDELQTLRMNKEGRASDRVEGVAEALELFIIEGEGKREVLNETGQWKQGVGTAVVKAMLSGVWPAFLRERVMVEIGFNDAAKANPDAVLDIMRRHAKAFRVVEEYLDWKSRSEVPRQGPTTSAKGCNTTECGDVSSSDGEWTEDLDGSDEDDDEDYDENDGGDDGGDTDMGMLMDMFKVDDKDNDEVHSAVIQLCRTVLRTVRGWCHLLPVNSV